MTDKINDQIHPAALRILEKHWGPVPKGFAEDSTPNFKGMSTEWWRKLVADQPKVFKELIDICRADYPTFAALLLKVFNKKAGAIQPFIFNDAQLIVYNRWALKRMNGQPFFGLNLKARQLGITTFWAGEQQWELWRSNDVRTLMVAHDEALLKEIVGTHRLFYEELPDIEWVRPKLRKMSTGAKIPLREIYYSDRRSQGDTAVAKNIEQRGARRLCIVQSEGAFYPDLRGLNDAMLPQLPPRGSKARCEVTVVIETTPNGQNAFYEYWQLAKNPESEWEAIFLPWFVAEDIYSLEPPKNWRLTQEQLNLLERLSVERRKIDGKPVTRAQIYWREQTILNDCGGSEEAFDMEYPSDDQTCFLMYESQSIFKEQLKALTQDCQDADIRAGKAWKKSHAIVTGGPLLCDLKWKDAANPFEIAEHVSHRKPKMVPNAGELWVWEPPVPEHIYVIGADVAGVGSDSAIATVLDVTAQRQVAEIATKRTLIDFADFCVHLGLWYNNALLYPELNYMGTMFTDRVISHWRYPFLGKEEKWGEGAQGKRYGFLMSENTKGPLVAKMEWYIKERFIRIASRNLLAELATFNYDGLTTRGNKMYSASGRHHDDRVVALALSLWAVAQSPRMRNMIESKQFKIPDAVEMGINSAPQMEGRKWTDNLPKALKELLPDEDKVPVYQNYIRGFGDH